jgi:small-conductance mechanosensitive channel
VDVELTYDVSGRNVMSPATATPSSVRAAILEMRMAEFETQVADRPLSQISHQAIVEQFRARGIDIPFPQRDVRMIGQTNA